jgi:hypothetical protein
MRLDSATLSWRRPLRLTTLLVPVPGFEVLNALAAMLVSFAAVPRGTRRTTFRPLPKRQGPMDKRHRNGSADKGSGGNGAKVQSGRYCPAML